MPKISSKDVPGWPPTLSDQATLMFVVIALVAPFAGFA
jgi:hypothetical protein